MSHIFVHCLFSFSVCWLNKHLLSPTCVSGCVRTEFIEGMRSSAWLGPAVWASKEGSARKEHQNFSGTPHPSRFVVGWPEPQIMAACPHTHAHADPDSFWSSRDNLMAPFRGHVPVLAAETSPWASDHTVLLEMPSLVSVAPLWLLGELLCGTTSTACLSPRPQPRAAFLFPLTWQVQRADSSLTLHSSGHQSSSGPPPATPYTQRLRLPSLSPLWLE